MTFLGGGGSAWSRRAIVMFGFGAVLSTASMAAAQAAPAGQPPAPAAGQTPAPAAGQAPGAAAAPAADPFKFMSDSAAIIWIIKPEKTADFEAAWSVIRQRLASAPAEKPELKALGDSLKIYKADVAPGADGVTYIFVADPASKTTSYGVSPFLLYDSGLFMRAEADELFNKLAATINRINPLPLKNIK